MKIDNTNENRSLRELYERINEKKYTKTNWEDKLNLVVKILDTEELDISSIFSKEEINDLKRWTVSQKSYLNNNRLSNEYKILLDKSNLIEKLNKYPNNLDIKPRKEASKKKRRLIKDIKVGLINVNEIPKEELDKFKNWISCQKGALINEKTPQNLKKLAELNVVMSKMNNSLSLTKHKSKIYFLNYLEKQENNLHLLSNESILKLKSKVSEFNSRLKKNLFSESSFNILEEYDFQNKIEHFNDLLYRISEDKKWEKGITLYKGYLKKKEDKNYINTEEGQKLKRSVIGWLYSNRKKYLIGKLDKRYINDLLNIVLEPRKKTERKNNIDNLKLLSMKLCEKAKSDGLADNDKVKKLSLQKNKTKKSFK